MPGLAPPNLRLVQNEPEQNPDDETIVIGEPEPVEGRELDDKGNTISIEHDDGSITISLDGKPLETANSEKKKRKWFDNLVDDIDEMELGRIADELLRGIDDDISTRKDWIENRALGIKMLGLQIELPSANTSGEGEAVTGQSRVRHPLLLEAVLRFQANARSEMLPTDGPVKLRDDNNNATLETDNLADAFQKDFNHYLTSTASEYYPDTDRMFFMLGFGGSAFKKVYFCPLRMRPVSETVDAEDLIVSNNTTDLKNALRITHRIKMKPSTVRRMQILGVYKDVDLPAPVAPEKDSAAQEKDAVQGQSPTGTMNPEDNDRLLYETYCELSIKGFEHQWKGKDSGLSIPYRVTIDQSSREILSVVRNYDEETKELPEAKQTFVDYVFIPGFGFYGIGLLNILGNTNNALTAVWRELLDAGMFANFPGFLMSDQGGRQDTNIFRVPPGGGAQVKTGGLPINQAIMPLPYKEPGPALMNLATSMGETGQRLGGTSELQVGEGKQDAPVGTTLAMIDQATKLLNAVHKRMHSAQAREFALMRDCFKEHPESFWQRNRKPARPWDEATFLQALEEADLVPQADPNTSSHAQRLMKVVGLKQLQAASQTLYDPIAVDKAALRALGWSNPDEFMAPPEAQSKPPPEIVKGEAEIKIKQQEADAKTFDAQTDRIKVQAEAAKGPEAKEQKDESLGWAKLQQDNEHLRLQAETLKVDNQNRDLDRKADLAESHMSLAGDLAKAREEHHHELVETEKEHAQEHALTDKEHKHQKGLAAARPPVKTAASKPAKKGKKK